MTHLYLIRHGAYERGEPPYIDLGLTPEGRSQAERLRDRLVRAETHIDVLISSPSPRALQTAEILASGLNLPVIVDAEVEEWRNFGDGAMNQEEIIGKFMSMPVDQRAFLLPGPGLETWAQFAFRIALALNRIAEEYAQKSVAIVAHGGTIEASFAYCFGLSPLVSFPLMMMFDPAYTSITHWRKIHSVNLWRLEHYNDVQHLDGETP